MQDFQVGSSMLMMIPSWTTADDLKIKTNLYRYSRPHTHIHPSSFFLHGSSVRLKQYYYTKGCVQRGWSLLQQAGWPLLIGTQCEIDTVHRIIKSTSDFFDIYSPKIMLGYHSNHTTFFPLTFFILPPLCRRGGKLRNVTPAHS